MAHIANCMRRTLDRTDAVYMEETLTISPTTAPSLKESAEHSARNLASKYNIWPRSGKTQVFPWNPNLSSDRMMALSAGRSPTALSDTSVNLQRNAVFWKRGGSLSNRRKISVPELVSQPPSVMASVDSPTVPGMAPFPNVASANSHHERSSSAPSWRDCAFGDAMVQCVSKPRVNGAQALVLTPWTTPVAEEVSPVTFNPTRPLSPILSPTTTPTTAGPVLQTPVLSPIEIPPKVPPKSPPRDKSLPPSKANSKGSLSTSTMKRSPPPCPPEWPTVTLPSSPPRSGSSSPRTRSADRKSPSGPAQSEQTNENVTDASIIHRGRPIKSKKCKNLTSEREPDGWKLPTGIKSLEADLVLPESEKDMLRKQACEQVERFEVLRAKHVKALSKELRALDDRCDYLRETYRSLRAGRQRLQRRMITYLKSDSIPFSKEKLLKQEEALIELDKSIDDWVIKLDVAENRRLRVRQKLLEHIAAALMLDMTAYSPGNTTCSTPPDSPTKIESPKPLRIDRKEVESIKVYADDQVLSLFSDIEQAVAQMCEAY